MSGGSSGSSKKVAATTTKAKPNPSFSEYGAMPIVNTIDPFMGNNQQLLAAQLAAGFGGTPKGYIDQSEVLYSPSQSVGLFEPLTGTKSALKNGKYNMKGTTGLLALDRVLGITASNTNGAKVSASKSSGSSRLPGSYAPLYVPMSDR